MKFSVPVFPDQAYKMAASAVSSGRRLVINVSLNTFPQSSNPKTFGGGGLGKGTAQCSQKGRKVLKSTRVLQHVTKAIRAKT